MSDSSTRSNSVSRWIIWLAISALVGFFVMGSLLYRSAIGLDASAFPAGETIQKLSEALFPSFRNAAGGLFWLVAIGLVLAFSGFFFGRAGGQKNNPNAKRRNFLLGSGFALSSILASGGAAFARAILGVGNDGRGWGEVGDKISDRKVAFTHSSWPDAWKGSRIKNHRRLGRTNYQVSDIVLGTGRLVGEDGERIARAAVERGVNYIDTSPDYSGTGSEQAVGKAISGVRQQLFLATKFCTPTGHLPTGTPVADYEAAVEASLKRLGTDYVDLIHVHSCDEIDRLLDENVHEAFDRLKQAGKVRFLGVSTHTPNLLQVANAAIDSGRFDIMMLAYHHGIWSQLNQVISRARQEQDMGIVAMKTLKGAKHNGLAGFREHAEAYTQAALRWALSNQDVSCAVISFFKDQHVDEYIYASGGQLNDQDHAILQRYDQEIIGSYCAPHCGQCLGQCPEELPIHDILRYRMYSEDYGWKNEGIRLYSQLTKNAAQCSGCSAPCLGSCPTGIAIPERMIDTHKLLAQS